MLRVIVPELPEVETVLRGLKPHLENAVVQNVVVRQPRLRWPIPSDLEKHLISQSVIGVSRRGKYLLVAFEHGTLLVHLGMSGNLRILPEVLTPKRHDHVDIEFTNGSVLRYHDPRRFGAVLWSEVDAIQHPLLKSLGPEPLEDSFNVEYLQQVIQNKRVAIKTLIMNSHVVVGIGNIYATEALFLAKIHPATQACQLTKDDCTRLIKHAREVLGQAITQGGTTLKDFTSSDGNPGYFSQKLKAYGRGGLPCLHCETQLETFKQNQRSTVFCKTCQPIE